MALPHFRKKNIVILLPEVAGYDGFRNRVLGFLHRFPVGRAPEYAIFIPDFTVLLFRLLIDPRTSAGRRIMSGAALMYVLSPADLVPDAVPGLGLADDLLFLVLTVRQLIKDTDPELLKELWPSSDLSLLEAMQKTLDRVEGAVPLAVRNRWMAKRFF